MQCNHGSSLNAREVVRDCSEMYRVQKYHGL